MTSDFLRLAKVKRFAAVAALVVVGVAASSGLTATKAKADEYWRHHHGDYYRYHDYYRGPRVYVAPPYYYGPPRPVYVPPPVYYAPPPPPPVYYPSAGLNVVIPIR
ncbi:hypothetical protein [Nitrospirillum amazonense]|uniref:PXPV repeat-containing protein n=1 Tax=Nitrospirillum amazonense TaxID=28077 RepID=A0A560JVF1_9PROT|nr:hypothetical protein [Nitrospirillum amazonense]MDG3442009.1 hypothetical protein [Nitrospirillum amazonense]TWB73494.1 hypothetical protein FBZ87_105420 [Nitrospirillum amazonense]